MSKLTLFNHDVTTATFNDLKVGDTIYYAFIGSSNKTYETFIIKDIKKDGANLKLMIGTVTHIIVYKECINSTNQYNIMGGCYSLLGVTYADIVRMAKENHLDVPDKSQFKSTIVR